MSKDWSVAEAKAQLSEILRRAQTEGPQRIGKQRTFTALIGGHTVVTPNVADFSDVGVATLNPWD